MGSSIKYIVEVTKNHYSEFPNPLKLLKGERLSIGDKKTAFKGWIWCTTESGNSGWVPENFLKRNKSQGIMNVDYDATELTAIKGERLSVLSEESQWLWCVDNKNRKGWVPRQNVRKL